MTGRLVGVRWRGRRRVPTGLVVGGAMLLAAVIAALLGPLLLGGDPQAIHLDAMLQPPSLAHPFGTDNFGRDVFTRVLHGTAIDLQMGLFLTLPALVLGSAVGIVSGYRGGLLDALLMRLSDMLQAFPGAILTIAVVAALGPGFLNLYLAGAFFGWIGYARLLRGEVLVVKKLDYVSAARALGASDRHVVRRHILPHVAVQTVIFASSGFIQSILIGSSLGFLGLGAQPPAPEWGLMIAEGRGFLVQAPWMSAFPGLAIVAVGGAASLVGDGLADMLRPGR